MTFYLDSKGKPYHREAGVMPGGPEEYARRVLKVRKKREEREAQLKAASDLSGMKKAKASQGTVYIE